MAAELMAQVEAVLRRVMSPATPSADKTQLESELARLQQDVGSCLPVVYALLATSADPYALWFAVTTLEQYVATRWPHLAPTDKQRIREVAWWQVLDASVPAAAVPFVRQKLRKVVADIARLEWTASASSSASASSMWPECMTQIEALVVAPATQLHGVALLRVVVEELGRDDALAVAARIRSVQTQLRAEAPKILTLMAGVLQENRAKMEDASVGDDEWKQRGESAALALQLVQQLLAWTPVAELLQQDAWLAVLVEWSALWTTQGMRHPDVVMEGASLTALRCLTDVLGQRVAMARVDAVLITLIRALVMLIQQTLGNTAASEAFVDQVTECLSVFVTQHGARLQHPQYANDGAVLMEALLAWTTQQPRIEAVQDCLRVWDVVVASVAGDDDAEDGSPKPMPTAFAPTLAKLLVFLLDVACFATNRTRLEELSNDDDDVASGSGATEDGLKEEDWIETRYGTSSLQDIAQLFATRAMGGEDATTSVELSEYRQFVIETIALVRRLAAIDACGQTLLERVLPRVQDAFQRVMLPLQETSPAIPDEEVTMQDYAVNCALLASIPAPHPNTWPMLQLYLALTEHVARNRLYLRSSFVARLHAEAFACLRPCLVGVPAALQGESHDEAQQVLERVLLSILQTLDGPAPAYVKQAALQVLATLAAVLRQQSDVLLQLPSMVGLRSNLHAFSRQLSLRLQGDLFKAMGHAVLQVPVVANSDQGAAKDSEFASIVLPLCTSLTEVAQSAQQNVASVFEPAVVAQSVRDCYLVHCLARAVEDKPIATKRVFWQAVQPAWQSQQLLLTVCVRSQTAAGGSIAQILRIVDAIMRVQAQLLQSLRKVMDKATVSDVLSGFVSLFADTQLSGILNSQGTQGLRILAGFLQLLAAVMDEPTTMFSSFVPNILDLCFGTLKEPIFAHPESEVLLLGPFVSLVDQILDKHFRVFVTSPSRTLNADGVRERAFASEAAQASFTVLFQSLTAILTRAQNANAASEDGRASIAPRLGSQVLELLAHVDQAHGLFALVGFRDLRLTLLSTLLNGLSSGRLHVLQDQVVSLVHRLAAVDFAEFYQQFLPTFIQEVLTPQQLSNAGLLAGGDDAACLHWSGQVDLPTFTQDVLGFLHDIRVLRAQATE